MQPVAPRLLMCKPHWYSLPRATRDAIWREYVPGQELSRRPTFRYLAVFWLAVAQTAAESFRAGLMERVERNRQRAIAGGAGDPLVGLVTNGGAS